MRALLALLTAGAVGTGAFALNELSSLHHTVTIVATAPPLVAQLPTPAATAPAETPTPVTSSWRGALPFSGVPAAPITPIEINQDDVDSDDVIDESDRCPDEPEDRDGREDDGCPERIVDPEPNEVIQLQAINIY